MIPPDFRGTAPDERGVVHIRTPIFYWTFDQIETMLAVPKGWARQHARVAGEPINSLADKTKMLAVDLTPDEPEATLRIRHEELVKFCRHRRITFGKTK